VQLQRMIFQKEKFVTCRRKFVAKPPVKEANEVIRTTKKLSEERHLNDFLLRKPPSNDAQMA
jgi:hypothetical protein